MRVARTTAQATSATPISALSNITNGVRQAAILIDNVVTVSLLPERFALSSAGFNFAAAPLQVSLHGITANHIRRH
jgi:hypothetical protein